MAERPPAGGRRYPPALELLVSSCLFCFYLFFPALPGLIRIRW